MQHTLCAYNITRRSFLGLSVHRADTFFTRLRGLLGRTRLDGDDGMWVVPSKGIHSIGVLFAVDLVYLDADEKVVHTIENFRPFRIAPLKIKAQTVLELPLRTIYSSRTQTGDQIRVCSPEQLKSNWNAPSRM
ncbi:MAG TPA: DUF192 domain-containing protein [Bryobacteraceae bacterium]|nr:DUF192 domain-containing protein [Bryobacteraceae bacterium]